MVLLLKRIKGGFKMKLRNILDTAAELLGLEQADWASFITAEEKLQDELQTKLGLRFDERIEDKADINHKHPSDPTKADVQHEHENLAVDYIVAYETGITGVNLTNGWYRKWKSGWVEQGGTTLATSTQIDTSLSISVNVTLPVVMASGVYSISGISVRDMLPNIGNVIVVSNQARTGNGFTFRINATASTTDPRSITWEVKGMGG
jgi:hypothetical protein